MKTRKTVATILVVLIVLLGLLKIVDDYSSEYTTRALTQAVVTYGSARALGGVVSVVQESSVEVSPAGVGMSLALGQSLDPLNDLLEQFSEVMMLSVASLGIQQVLLSLGGIKFFSVMTVLTGVLFLLAICGRVTEKELFVFLSKTFLFVVLMRFSVPIVVLGNEVIYMTVLNDRYLDASGAIHQAAGTMEEVAESMKQVQADPERAAPENEVGESAGVMDRAMGLFGGSDDPEASVSADATDAEADQGWGDAVGDWWDDTVAGWNPLGQLESVQAAVSGAIGKIFELIVVFILQTIVFPLLFLFVFYRISQAILKMDLWGFFMDRMEDAPKLKAEDLEASLV